MSVKSFYSECFKNINSNNTFFKYYNYTKNYSDLKIFYSKFLNTIKNKERLKIVTFSDKTYDMYATIASVFLSNNIWIPLSNNLPLNRIIKIFVTSKPNIIILPKNSLLLKDKIFLSFIKKSKIKIFSYEEINNLPKKKNKISKKKINKKNLSMIFFTSGSTGEPKGVCITYQSFISCFEAKKDFLYKNIKGVVFGDYHDPSFVISLVIFFPCFYLGGTISPSQNLIENLNPSNHIEKNNVNVLITVPSTISRISDHSGKKKINANIKILIMCGEPFSLKLAKYIFRSINPRKLYNFYGSTEVSPWVFYHDCKKKDFKNFLSEDFMPVGKPLGKTKIKILNQELLVSGPMLSNGYIEKKQNKDVFVFHKGVRWYRTSDQIILFKEKYFIKGRMDKVIKIHGYRVDLNDIERNLRKIDGVDDAITFLKKINDTKVLLCAIKSKKIKKENFLIEKISQKLPNYMIPKKFKIYKDFPLNRSGKTDRKKIMA